VVFVESGSGGLEVPSICETVASDGPEFGELEMAFVEFKDKASDGLVFREVNPVPDTAWDDADFIRTDEELAKLGLDIEDPVLRDDEEIAVRRIESRIRVHGFARSVNKYAESGLHGGIASPRDKMKRVDPVNCLVEVEGIPSELIGNLVEVFPERRGRWEGSGVDWFERKMGGGR
jgi:hypothetical protein